MKNSKFLFGVIGCSVLFLGGCSFNTSNQNSWKRNLLDCIESTQSECLVYKDGNYSVKVLYESDSDNEFINVGGNKFDYLDYDNEMRLSGSKFRVMDVKMLNDNYVYVHGWCDNCGEGKGYNFILDTNGNLVYNFKNDYNDRLSSGNIVYVDNQFTLTELYSSTGEVMACNDSSYELDDIVFLQREFEYLGNGQVSSKVVNQRTLRDALAMNGYSSCEDYK